jgi:tRNA A37 methylthiotransferase MiaB
MDVMPDGKTACIAFADGCPRGVMDAALVVEYFRENGWTVTTSFSDASMVLISTCGGVDFAEDRCMKLVEIASRKMRKSARLVLFGCLPGISGDRLRDAFGAELVTPSALGRLDGIIGARVPLAEIKSPNVMEPYIEQFDSCYSWFERNYVNLRLLGRYPFKLKARFMPHVKALSCSYSSIADIKVTYGCMGKCTYCAIRFGEGPLSSKPLLTVLDEFRAGLAEGRRTFRLIGGDVGAYGQDAGSDITVLLDAMLEHPGDYKIVWDDFNPEWLIRHYTGLRRIFAENADRIGYAGFPVQTGNQRILGLMNRDYTVKDAKWHIAGLKKAAPGLKITTHAIIGFPSETEEEFEDTLSMLGELSFTQVAAFKYCDRPNTEASGMPGKLPEKVKDKRLWRMSRMFPKACVIG